MLDDRIRRGLAAQLDGRRRRIDAGERPLGWKVGFGAAQAMAALDIARPLVGYLLRSAIVADSTRLSFAGFTTIALEPEIAVYLGSDLEDGSDAAAVRAAISALGPAIEIADVSFPPAEGPEAILAGNIYQRGIVLGPADPRRAGARLEGLGASVRVNGSTIDVPADLEANTGPIVGVIATVADTLAAMGERLRAGELVIAGSIVPPLFPQSDTELVYTLGDALPIAVSVGGKRGTAG